MNTKCNFAKWEAKATQMTIEGLQYSVRDCREAAKCASGFDAAAEAKYMDELSVYMIELNKRGAVAHPEHYNIAA